MNAGLLFFLAHRTSQCQAKIGRYFGYYGIDLANIKVCPKLPGFNPSMAQLLSALPIVAVVSTAEGKRPDCAPRLFETLRIPIDMHGEPKGVLQLRGEEKTGYVIESINQAIVVFPDIPSEIEMMLRPACERLQKKFSLTGEVPAQLIIPYEELIEKAMNSK